MTIPIDILNQLPGYIGWKNINLTYEGCNQNLASILGLTHSQEIVGLTDAYFHPHDPELTQFHQQNDALALKGNTVKALHRSTFPYDGSYFYFIKQSVVNAKNEITGLIYHCQQFTNLNFIVALNKIEKKHVLDENLPRYYYLDTPYNPYELSTRELETLFFLLRGKTAKKIAEIMQLSKRTVESYIEQIKNKFGCENKAELLYLATTNGYINVIPTRFLNMPL